MDINKNKVTLMTQSGEFIDVKRNKLILEIGSIYTGEIYTKLPFRKLIATAAVFIFFIFGSAEAYAYYTPTSTFIIGGTVDIELKTNKWNKIISVNGLNNEGKELIEETYIKHTSIDNGLQKILETTKRTFEDVPNNKDLTLTIKDSNGYINEKRLKSKIHSTGLPISIQIVTSHAEENTQNKNSENNNSNTWNSKTNNDELDYSDKENDTRKNNTNNKKSDESNKNSNSQLNKDKVDYSYKENDNIKNNTNNKKPNNSKNNSKLHDDDIKNNNSKNSNSELNKDKIDNSDKENNNKNNKKKMNQIMILN